MQATSLVRSDERAAGVSEQGSSAGRTSDADGRLEAIERQRTHIAFLMVAVIAAFTLTVLVGSLFFGNYNRELDRMEGAPGWFRWALMAATLMFSAYIVHKEILLRRLTRELVAEHVEIRALAERLREVTALAEAGRAMNSGGKLDDVLDVILDATVKLLDGTEGSIMLLSDDGGKLELVCYRGSSERYGKQRTLPVGEGIAGRVAETGEALLVVGDADSGGFKNLPEKSVSIHSSMCVPMTSGGEFLGVINLNDTEGGRDFTQTDLRLLQIFADDAAGAVARARTIAA